jgi:hypothetical protein
MLENTEFKEMKEYIENEGLNEDIIEEVTNTCEILGRYVMNWDMLDDCFIVIYNDYNYDIFGLY